MYNKIQACAQDAQQRVVASFPRELWNSEVAELWGGKWIGILKEYEYWYENEHWPVLRLVRYLEMLGFSRCWKKYATRVNLKCRKAFLYRIEHWASVPILIFNIFSHFVNLAVVVDCHFVFFFCNFSVSLFDCFEMLIGWKIGVHFRDQDLIAKNRPKPLVLRYVTNYNVISSILII